MERGDIEITPRHITGLVAVTLSIYFLITHRGDLSIVAASIYFTLACITDTLKSKIPNLLNAVLIITGLSINVAAAGMQGLLLSLSGLGLGICLLLLPYLMGGMGAGDVKALGSLGALIGPGALLHVFVYMAFFGGGLALLHFLFHQRDMKRTLQEAWGSIYAAASVKDAASFLSRNQNSNKANMRFPYATAIAFGYYSFIYWGKVL